MTRTDSPLTTRLIAARVDKTPQVVAALTALADAARLLADEMDADPGMGIGLAYAPLWVKWQDAEHLLREYQNRPLRDEGPEAPLP